MNALPPMDRRLCTVWTFYGDANEPIACELWEVAGQYPELRVIRDGEVHMSSICMDGAEEAATLADEWARALRNQGFTERFD